MSNASGTVPGPRRVRAALVQGGFMGLGGAAMAESDPGLSLASGTALGAGAGVLFGLLAPRLALGGAWSRREDVRKTFRWRVFRPLLVVLYVVLAVGNVQTGRWILGAFMVVAAAVFLLLPRPSRDGSGA
ncbi:hypothetical protein GCM10009801_00370 [Streptomyces albiaxialis]|uniref:Integral membrane protein n=1 Tax=Streptomyces albiaxialis TaxID=329523 RepID=A0ABP5GWS9_9ACTN